MVTCNSSPPGTSLSRDGLSSPRLAHGNFPLKEAAVPEGSSEPRCLFWETREFVNNILHDVLEHSIPLFFHALYTAFTKVLPGNESG